MPKHFWNTILGINSCLWFIALGFLAYAFGMLIVALDWRQFLLALVIFAAVSLTQVVLAALSH